ncbi:MAG: hypothetical protein JWO22_1688 [Frankiales bacterium]|nr:hypothetical protein [Frankiales bacterium]
MASRKDPVARARGRKPAPVKKPFPWGFAAGVGALVLFLGGLLAYSATHVGIGDHSSLAYAETQISGLQKHHGLDANHVDGKFIDYPNETTQPPYGGNHNSQWQSCQVYTTAIANEHAVHALEHGAVWVTYNPDKVKGNDLTTLTNKVKGDAYHMMSPYPGLKSAVSLQAWGEQLFVDKVSDARIKKFLTTFTQGPQTREVGASCTGITDDRTKGEIGFDGHASYQGKPAGAANPGQTPTPVASVTTTSSPAPSSTATPKATASASASPKKS